MLQMKLADGTVLDPLDAAWTLTPKGGSKVYEWKDVRILSILDPGYTILRGMFGPEGSRQIPIRGLRFTDLSDLSVEIPMPVEAAKALADELGAETIQVARTVPASLILPR